MQVPLGDTYYFLFTTRQYSDGAPTTLSGTPVLSVYEENNATQITSGVAVSADYDTVTGLNECSVVATTGNGYEVGKYYSVVITTGTVGGTSVVGEVVGHFRIIPAEASAGIPDVNVTNWNDTALSTTNPLPNAAAGAAGGLPTDSTGKTSFNDISTSDVNAQVVDVMETDTHAEIGTATPPASPTKLQMLQYLYKNWRNKKEQTSTTFTLYNDDGSTAGQTASVSDNGTTATKNEMTTG